MNQPASKSERYQHDQYRPLFTISVDKFALRGELFTGEQMAELTKMLADIQNKIPYLRIDATGREEKQSERRFKGVQKLLHLELKRELRRVIKAYKGRSSEWRRWRTRPDKPALRPLIEHWSEREELPGAFEADREGTLAAISGEQVEIARFYQLAEAGYDREVTLIAQKANGPFLHADRIKWEEEMSAVPPVEHFRSSKAAKRESLGKDWT